MVSNEFVMETIIQILDHPLEILAALIKCLATWGQEKIPQR